MHLNDEVSSQRKFPTRFFILFSLFLACVYAGVFWWISTVTDRLILDDVRGTASRLVDSHLLYHHFNEWETRSELTGLVRLMTEEMMLKNYEAKFLALEESRRDDVSSPRDKKEREILEGLQLRWREQIDTPSFPLNESSGSNTTNVDSAEGVTSDKDVNSEEDVTSEKAVTSAKIEEVSPVFDERLGLQAGDAGAGYYQYYQPVYWRKSCILCHRALSRGSAFPAFEEGGVFDNDSMYRVVAVIFRNDGLRRRLTLIRTKLAIGGAVAYLITLVGTLMLVIPLTSRPIRCLAEGSKPIDCENMEGENMEGEA